MIKAKESAHQLMGTCSYGDAIGNMALEHRSALRAAGYNSEIYAERIHPKLIGDIKTIQDYHKEQNGEHAIIYHLSIGSDVSKLVYNSGMKKILYYHNITPPEFFRKFHDVLWLKCSLGREELRMFKDKTDFALADSEYNRKELEELGYKHTASLPVPINLGRLSEEHRDSIITDKFNDKRTNILFVGRVIPNKKIEDVIKNFHLYRIKHDPTARLFIVGSYTAFETYMYWLWRLVKKLGEEDNITFTGHVTDSELAAYYKIADLFLMMSEHEGFCVPLLEAFAAGVPVIGYDKAAVGETMDGGGILIGNKDPDIISAIMNNIITDKKYRNSIIAGQASAIERYKKKMKEKTLVKYLGEVI